MARNLDAYGDFSDFSRDTQDASTGSRLPDVEKYEIGIEKLEKEVTNFMEKEYQSSFNRQSMFMGNGIYSIAGLYSTDTRELFLMYCLLREDLKMDDFACKMDAFKRRKDTSDGINVALSPKIK